MKKVAYEITETKWNAVAGKFSNPLQVVRFCGANKVIVYLRRESAILGKLATPKIITAQ